MTFLVLASVANSQIDPSRLLRAAGDAPVVWFDPDDHSRGGAVCFSPLASVARLRRGERGDCLIVGRIRLDRRAELRSRLSVDLHDRAVPMTDADLCLHAWVKWGEEFVDHIHGDFAFAIYDGTRREFVCVRDRFGVRMLAWSLHGNACWIAGSLEKLHAVAAIDTGQLDATWISDFLRSGICQDASRSVYASISRLPPAHFLSIELQGPVTRRYWTLQVDGPLHLKTPSDYIEEFHLRLDLAMRDRLPSDRLGVMLSGGLDSSTLAAKALELGTPDLKVFARTWLVGGDVDPEAQASASVARHLGLDQTIIEAERLRFDVFWQSKLTAPPEPGLNVLKPLETQEDSKAMREQAMCWFYGEGPDNALTFEWQMHFQWMVRHRHWGGLADLAAKYLATKSLVDWKTSFQSRLGFGQLRRENDVFPEPDWVRGKGSAESGDSLFGWRPLAHRSFSNPMWSMMFEALDADGDTAGIEWRHPYMDLRVLEFLLATPPVPWARHKLLIRSAMKGRLPDETLRRAKTPLYRDDLGELLLLHLPALPKRGDVIEAFVDLTRLPTEPHSCADVYALTRIAILQHWLKVRHG